MRITIVMATMIVSQDDHLCWCATDFPNWSINLPQTVGGMRGSSMFMNILPQESVPTSQSLECALFEGKSRHTISNSTCVDEVK